MDHVFSGTEEFVIRYIDDIVIWADDEMAHGDRLRELHRLAIVGGIYLKSKKGILCKPEVDMLGHVVGTQRIKPPE